MSAVAGRSRRRAAPAPARRRVRTVRSRASGRVASYQSYLIVALVGLLLFGIVTLQIRALQANIAAGRIDAERREVVAESSNVRATLAQAHPRSEIELFAKQLGMVRPGVDSYVPVRVKPQ
jgi:hypothetical protein